MHIQTWLLRIIVAGLVTHRKLRRGPVPLAENPGENLKDLLKVSLAEIGTPLEEVTSLVWKGVKGTFLAEKRPFRVVLSK